MFAPKTANTIDTVVVVVGKTIAKLVVATAAATGIPIHQWNRRRRSTTETNCTNGRLLNRSRRGRPGTYKLHFFVDVFFVFSTLPPPRRLLSALLNCLAIRTHRRHKTSPSLKLTSSRWTSFVLEQVCEGETGDRVVVMVVKVMSRRKEGDREQSMLCTRVKCFCCQCCCTIRNRTVQKRRW